MRLLFATSDLHIEGRSFEGFPLLLDKRGWPIEPAQSFLWKILVESGETYSKLTWEAYGRRLYDYFAFLDANELSWNEKSAPNGLSVIAKYRDWSLGELGINASTLNKRLNLITRFYQWCKKRELIAAVPFGWKKVNASSRNGLLIHVDRSGGMVNKATVMVREHKAPIKFLAKEQVRVCLALKTDPSHRLLFHMMVRTGMRSCEARTFPCKYVFNPRMCKGLRPGQMLSIVLNPADMNIKYGKPRTIDVPWSLMEDMWAYSLHEREVRKLSGEGKVSALVLTNNGTEYSKSGIVDLMKAFEKKAGFYVRAHMLRHTYGTYTLLALRKSKDFSGEPLLYVRDRMGHSDVQTTMIYLHLINQLEAQIVLAHEDEIDAMFLAEATSRDTGVEA